MSSPVVLFTSSWYPSRTHATLGNFVKRHAEAVATQTRVVALYVTSDPDLSQEFEITHEKENQVDNVVVYYKKVTSPIPVLSHIQKYKRNLSAFNLGMKWIEKFLKIDKFDIVHHNITYPAGIFPLHLKSKLNLPFVISENFTGFLPADRAHYTGLVMKYMCRSITRAADVICPVSQDLQDSMIDLGFKSEYTIVPNVVDMKTFYTNKKGPAPIDGKIKFIHVSTLNEEHKNMFGILRTIKKLSETHDVEFNIVHDEGGEMHKAYCEEIGIADKVNFLGKRDAKGVANELRNNHIFILFSNFENLPCVVLESIACGVPVVSSDIGGTREHLSKEFGELVDPLDEDGLFEKINHVIANYAQYDPTKLNAYAEKHFSTKNVGKQFIKVYDSVFEARAY
ncbi:MAG: glycosyltransferase [Flavobacteriales bacterium]|nr:glycosyltransferase [Flavobacteriales bacterium]